MKTIFSMLIFFITMNMYSQSSCACVSNAGTATADCNQGSDCACESKDGACSCGCKANSGNHLIQHAQLYNLKIENCNQLSEGLMINKNHQINQKFTNYLINSFHTFRKKIDDEIKEL